ncbi:helix-turn-helix domain-containing protein [Metallumcola ferriviriculae]|uniref:Helix-turn-helix domain-containing protein n=1 Tax=Metallumcola ferriviriculae TaxID=3039180 RepID=A0AAU0UM14_9FIRM|nr:helix-turn-helix domain-containing protein [Desulfitibacteraceae bacterium MK1]
MVILGEKIRELREERDYTLSDLAERAGLSISYLSEIERGAKRPSLKTLDKIAAALNVSRNVLVDIGGEKLKISMGDKIRMLREEDKLTLGDLAKNVGISPSYLSEIERESVHPSVSTIKSISRALEVPITTIMHSHESTIGLKLRASREEQGMTQADLADKAGVSAGLIGQIENGRVQPSLKTLENVADVLGVSPCYFVLDNDSIEQMLPSFSPELRKMLADDNVQAVLRLICNLSEDELKFILNFIQLFKKSKITNF